MARKQPREGEGMTLREASEKRSGRKKKERKKRREIPLFCDMKQKAFIFMAIRDG